MTVLHRNMRWRKLCTTQTIRLALQSTGDTMNTTDCQGNELLLRAVTSSGTTATSNFWSRCQDDYWPYHQWLNNEKIDSDTKQLKNEFVKDFESWEVHIPTGVRLACTREVFVIVVVYFPSKCDSENDSFGLVRSKNIKIVSRRLKGSFNPFEWMVLSLLSTSEIHTRDCLTGTWLRQSPMSTQRDETRDHQCSPCINQSWLTS